MAIPLSEILFIAAFAIQAIYFLLFIKAFGTYQLKKTENQPSVSVVIAARNAASNLPKLIEQIQNQNYPDYELIIVNDKSGDETYDLLKSYESESKIRVVTIESTPASMDSKKYALTLGIKAAKKDIILLTDADCQIDSTSWIETMTSGYDTTSQIGLGVSILQGGSGLLGIFSKFESLWTAIQYTALALLGAPYMGVGRNLTYRKTLFLENKGFNELMSHTGGDDDLFVNKHAKGGNTFVILSAKGLTYSDTKKDWKSFFIQKTRHLAAGKKYKLKHQLMLGLLYLSQVVFYALLVGLSLQNPQDILLWALFATRTILLYFTFYTFITKLGVPFKLWGLLFLDLLFVFYYLSTGLRAFFTKKVRWS